MTLSIYDASIPVFNGMLRNLAAILKKGEASAEARKIDPAVLIAGRLAPDMAPLSRQIQIASDAAKGAGARLAGAETPSFPDTETTFADLFDRIDKTIAYLDGLDPKAFEGVETRPITLKLPSGEMILTGQAFLLNFAMPNFYFHVTTAYDILRHNGVEIGKRDFLGAP